MDTEIILPPGIDKLVNGVSSGQFSHLDEALRFFSGVTPAFHIDREMVDRELSVLEQEELMTM